MLRVFALGQGLLADPLQGYPQVISVRGKGMVLNEKEIQRCTSNPEVGNLLSSPRVSSMPNQAITNVSNSATAVHQLPPTPVSVSIMVEDGEIVFRTEDGEALYTHDLDPPGKSVCRDACAAQWAPLLAETGNRIIGDWRTLQQSDGTYIWTYRNRIVYVALKNFQAKDNEGPWRLLAP